MAGLCLRHGRRPARHAALWRGRFAAVLRQRFAIPEAVPVKVAYSWLKEYAPLAAPAELAKQLTLAGLEVESVTPVAPPFSGVVVGEVLESGPHPNAEKLSVCQVTTDGSNRLQIICGAKNVRAGLTVAVAQVGAKLPKDVSIG